MVADDLLVVASVLEAGDAAPHAQRTACNVLQRAAVSVRRMEQQLDRIVASAQDEAALAAPVPLHRKPRFRLVVSS